MIKSEVNYRNISPKKLLSREFRHLLLLVYWPIYVLLYFFIERVYPFTDYCVIYCKIDDIIPFCELFFVPYVSWYVYLVVIQLYALRYDVETFKRFMKFTILTYTAASVFFILFPNIQHLRPAAFARDNIFTHAVGSLYKTDTCTNVCPSVHVIGAIGVLFAVWQANGLNNKLVRTVCFLITVLICMSTVFLKQHSIVDVIVGIIFALIGYLICFRRKKSPSDTF